MNNEKRNVFIGIVIIAIAIDEIYVLLLVILMVVLFESIMTWLDYVDRREMSNIDKEIKSLKKIEDNSKKSF